MSKFRLSRRACLKGLGVSMALPALEIMEPRKAHAQGAPLRFMAVYSPNGFLMTKWTPTAVGTTWPTPPLMAPLEAFRPDFSVVSGLGNYTASLVTKFGGSHTRACGSWLTQCPVGYMSTGTQNGISLDQIIATAIKDKTKFPSIQVGGRASSSAGNCEDQFSCAYNTHVSWSGPTTPLPKQVNPLDVFNRLFSGGAPMPPPGPMPGPVKPNNTNLYQKSILDVVNLRADALRKRLGKIDKVKLDEYFNSVREVEERIVRAGLMPGTNPGGTPATCTIGAPPRSTADTSLTFPQHLDLLSDMIALAFQCDVTRVATYMFEHSFSDTRSFPFLTGVTGRHHTITHTNNAAANAQEEKIDLFYVQRFAYLMGKLKAIKEGNGTVLDNSVIYFGSEFGDGHAHNHRGVAMIVAGKGGGKLKTGLHVKYELDPAPGTGADGLGNPKDTQLGHLHMSTLQCFGINQPSFGKDDKGTPIATRPLPELMV
jgi:hypothetical protein